jgi:hypothetical protein
MGREIPSDLRALTLDDPAKFRVREEGIGTLDQLDHDQVVRGGALARRPSNAMVLDAAALAHGRGVIAPNLGAERSRKQRLEVGAGRHG